MNTTPLFFYFLIAAIVIIGIPTAIYNRHLIKSYGEAFYTFLLGIVFTLSSIIITAFLLKRWDSQFVIDFFLLKKTVHQFWILDDVAFFGEVSLILGIMIFIVAYLKKSKIIPENFFSKAARKAECKFHGQKVFADEQVAFDFLDEIHFFPVFFFIILPLALTGGFIYLWWKPLDFSIDGRLFFLAGVLVFLLAAISVFFWQWRKHGVSQIITDHEGIIFIGHWQKTQVPWKDVLGVDFEDPSLVAKIITRKGKFPFTITMKEKYKDYPQLEAGLLQYHWEYKDGTKKPLAIENCPLYIEIQKHIQNRPQ